MNALEENVGSIAESVAAINATLAWMAVNLATKADVKRLEAEMHQQGTHLTRWTVGTIIAAFALGFGIVKYTI